jgi:hypothetical protein
LRCEEDGVRKITDRAPVHTGADRKSVLGKSVLGKSVLGILVGGARERYVSRLQTVLAADLGTASTIASIACGAS